MFKPIQTTFKPLGTTFKPVTTFKPIEKLPEGGLLPPSPIESTKLLQWTKPGATVEPELRAEIPELEQYSRPPTEEEIVSYREKSFEEFKKKYPKAYESLRNEEIFMNIAPIITTGTPGRDTPITFSVGQLR